MNEPPGARARVGLTGLTVAEHFRDFEGQDVLFFVDNIFRFTQVTLTPSQPHSLSHKHIKIERQKGREREQQQWVGKGEVLETGKEVDVKVAWSLPG